MVTVMNHNVGQCTRSGSWSENKLQSYSRTQSQYGYRRANSISHPALINWDKIEKGRSWSNQLCWSVSWSVNVC